MVLRKFRPVSPGLRRRISLVKEFDDRSVRPHKALSWRLKKSPGRSRGKVTVRHKGGGAVRLYRSVDFRRDKRDIPAKVKSIEYDPYRGANLALLSYPDGEYRYILAPVGLKIGQTVQASEKVQPRPGNSLPLGAIPLGTLVHNLEIAPGHGGQMVRGAGTAAQVISRDEQGGYVQVRLPSGELKRFLVGCYATVGQVGNLDHKNIQLGKAGRSRYLGRRPTVRGVAQNPRSHPHGGGEGRSGVGLRFPKTPWGKKALGKKTRRRRATDKFIVQERKR